MKRTTSILSAFFQALSFFMPDLAQIQPWVLLFLILVIGMGLGQEAQGQLPQRVITECKACEAADVHAADLNGDGNPDVLSASQLDNKIAWYENNGDGTFSDQKVITTNIDGAESVYAADLTGNGRPDVLSASSPFDYSGKIAWYENNGNGTFSGQKVITTNVDGAESVYVADLTGNGHLDVLSASSDGFNSSSKIAWYENNGNGTFSGQKVITTNVDGAESVYAADLTGNGRPDVLSASGPFDDSGKIAWYENNGDGTFSDQKIITTNVDRAQSVYAADLSGNGHLDVLSASSGDNKIAWYENNGDGSFSGQEMIITVTEATSVHAADLTGNGNLDVLSAGSGGRIRLHENSGNGTFFYRTLIAKRAQSVYATDLTGNGKPDVLSASLREDKIAWYENEGSDSFSEQQVITECKACGAEDVHAVDLTGNGKPDILSVSSDDNKIAWYENEGSDSFSEQQVITECKACGAEDVHAADLTENDIPDVLYASRDGITWYENNGDGSFSDQKVITTHGDTDVHTADLSGNGKPDILSASFNNGITWHENKGNGTFSNQKVITTSANGTRSVYAADLTDSGNPDVLSASDDGITWYENNGDGTFSGQKVLTTDVDLATDAHAADLTGDGYLDVLSASSSDNKVAWYENNGDGTFSDQKIITTNAQGVGEMHVVDLDGNNTPDVISASYSDDKIARYENNGDGSFSDQKVITTNAAGAQSVYAADLTGNGKPDILSASSKDSKIAWYKNTQSTLPVELVRLDAKVDGEKARLSWQTASETNNAGFRIQRRVDEAEGRWKQVGRVAGSGTTTEPQSYRFTDSNLPYEADRLTYRLKQVDTDGSTHYSDVVTVQRSVNEVRLLAPFPNPAGQRATVRYALPEATEVTLRLYDVLGREVRTIQQEAAEGRQERQVDLSELPSGTYFLRLRAKGETKTERLTVVR